jgi:3-hydroxyethyl bacteriochlorophyllide a dehydrogenase
VNARAVVFPEAGSLELRDVVLREEQPDEVVVETAFSSISSGTERLLFNGALSGLPHLRYPLVPGYEASGRVIRVGADVTGVREGDEVFVGGSMCYVDVAAAFGGQSSHLVKRASQVVPLRGIRLDHAPLLALAATALHGVRRLGPVDGKRVAVLGVGAVGNLAAQFLLAAGATVIAIDRSAARLRAVPAHEWVDASHDVPESVVAPVAAAIEATGSPSEIARTARLIEPQGSIVLLSFYEKLETRFEDLFTKEATLLVAREWAPADLVAARDAAADGSVSLAPLAGHVVPIERYAAAYDTAFNDTSVPKVVLQWA